MPSKKYTDPKSVIEPNYFSNWGDLWYPKIANKLLVTAARIYWLTPNIVTIVSFILYSLAAIYVVIGGGWSMLAAILFPIAYILDCLDGQLARYTGKSSEIGDYLDKTLDVLKIGIITLAMSIAAYNITDKTYYFILGFLACFGLLFRYYIKLETMFGAINRDKNYLDKSRAKRQELYKFYGAIQKQSKTFSQKMQWVWIRNRSIFAFDEAEFVTFGALAALIQRPDIWCWIFGISQITLALYRLVGRGNQLVNNPVSLLIPLRK